jgi:hypothetical protein
MALPELKRELQSIDEDAMGSATARSFAKSLNVSESHAQMEALMKEYPALSFAVTVLLDASLNLNASPDLQRGVLTGALAMAVALKELVDTEELNSIPTAE